MSCYGQFYKIYFPFSYEVETSKRGGLKQRGFSVFSLPYILHSDNDREFVNNLLWTLSRHGLENENWSMEKQEAPEC